jgi:hypothetical protein
MTHILLVINLNAMLKISISHLFLINNRSNWVCLIVVHQITIIIGLNLDLAPVLSIAKIINRKLIN